MPKGAVIADGPLAGRDPRLNALPAWALTWCCRLPGGEYEHYEHAGDGVYRYAGRCAAAGHKVAEWCDYRWGEHRCARLDEHDPHVCCCGTESVGASDV